MQKAQRSLFVWNPKLSIFELGFSNMARERTMMAGQMSGWRGIFVRVTWKPESRVGARRRSCRWGGTWFSLQKTTDVHSVLNCQAFGA